MKKSEYIEKITALLERTNEIPLLDLILRVLERSV